ncbi:MAG: NUDIX hydrolase [Actinobacteria bacterium]|nr:NUDIX hydrolase [Actinomycetota bacterium]
MRWPVAAHRVLGRGAVTDFVDDQVRTPSGELMARQYLLHPGAVGIIAWDEADRIAVVRQYRHPVSFRLTEPPAGLLDHADEDFMTAAARELAEEAGLRADRWQVLVDLFSTPGANQESLRIFLARELSAVPVPNGFVADHEEADMEVCWAARADLVDAVLAGRLQNPTMVAGVLSLEVARLSGRLDSLRPADVPWPAREVWRAHNAELAAVGDGDRA